MYAAMGAPFAGFGTSMVEDAMPSPAGASAPASAQPPAATQIQTPAPVQTGNGMQSGTEREVPMHLQQAPPAGAYMTAGGGTPWVWLAVGVGVTALGLWAFSRRRSRAG